MLPATRVGYSANRDGGGGVCEGSQCRSAVPQRHTGVLRAVLRRIVVGGRVACQIIHITLGQKHRRRSAISSMAITFPKHIFYLVHSLSLAEYSLATCAGRPACALCSCATYFTGVTACACAYPHTKHNTIALCCCAAPESPAAARAAYKQHILPRPFRRNIDIKLK